MATACMVRNVSSATDGFGAALRWGRVVGARVAKVAKLAKLGPLQRKNAQCRHAGAAAARQTARLRTAAAA